MSGRSHTARALAMAVLSLVLAAACSSADPAPVTPTVAAATSTPTPVARTALGPPPVSLSSTTPSATPTPVSLTATESTPASIPLGPAEERPGDADGMPFSTVDLRVAVEEERRHSFWLIDDREELCPASAVPGLAYWSAGLGGTDFGPVYVLWVYPDETALRRDWQVADDERPAPRFSCDLPSGSVFWNQNLVMTFDVWLSAGEALPLHGHHESPRDMPAVDAFLELEP